MPNTRNNLVLRTSSFQYTLQDLQLLDEDGNPYRQPFQRNITASELDDLGMPWPDDHESN
jgi:hypothetical protein